MLKSDFIKEIYNRPFDFMLITAFVVLLFITVLTAGCGEVKAEKSVLALDTVIRLTAEGKNSDRVLNDSAEFLKSLDKKANFDDNSELSVLNKDTSKNFINVSPGIYEMLTLGEYYTDFTKQNYNISAGALVKLWDKAREKEEIPQADDIRAAKSAVNAQSIILDDNKVKKSNADVELTFGGIAKGYAADKIYSLYKESDVTGFMNFGTSTILACGDKIYRVGIKNPRDENAMIGVVTLKNEVLSTSGDYERYFIKKNTRYHHIIDPFTGYPTNNGIASVTVIVPLSYENAGVMSDVLSTALMVAGEKGRDFLPDDVKVLFVMANGELAVLNGFELEN